MAKYFMRTFFLILLLSLFCIGCKEVSCKCGNEKCGSECKNQCDGLRCIPGDPCCDKCICRKLKN